MGWNTRPSPSAASCRTRVAASGRCRSPSRSCRTARRMALPWSIRRTSWSSSSAMKGPSPRSVDPPIRWSRRTWGSPSPVALPSGSRFSGSERAGRAATSSGRLRPVNRRGPSTSARRSTVAAIRRRRRRHRPGCRRRRLPRRSRLERQQRDGPGRLPRLSGDEHGWPIHHLDRVASREQCLPRLFGGQRSDVLLRGPRHRPVRERIGRQQRGFGRCR